MGIPYHWDGVDRGPKIEIFNISLWNGHVLVYSLRVIWHSG